MINRLTGMPKWFDLQRYHGSKHFNACEWYQALSDRAVFHGYIDCGLFFEQEGNIDELMSLLEEPLVFLAPPIKPSELDFQKSKQGVYALDVQDGELISDIINKMQPGDRDRWLNDPLPNYAASEHDLTEIWFREDHFVGVDLNIDNDRLVELFKEHLKVARDRLNRPKPWKVESMLMDLFDHKILPLIDLMLWQDATGYKLRNVDVITALNYSGNQDLVRVKMQNAIKVMGEPFLNTLLAIAARKSKV